MATQDSQGIKLFGKTIAFNGNITQTIKKEEEKQPPEPEAITAVRSSSSSDLTAEKRPDKIIACPRCKSMETKFCYFNNYNVNQPRHFCKGCHRYWTAGGALRNVPVGAGRRKSKPPDRVIVGMLGDGNGVHQVELINGLLVEKWHVAAGAHGGFRHEVPLKRLRCYSDGQSC
ncbi:hypothetical protein EUTSA_v10017316mg [Eutrema salsugineum]|uniref:Dof-type domain-containing protein n=1 Tax=Eutrema salsugineum TaxID=72664 RepID=V4MHJ8_EUTSA|nr:cyclic dof factor 4 isoform X2 [Eutrema salsugineum]ESQ52008.1 hypothetical protein EUTSA_v10017316mg [Eutrema salsugineum]